MRGGPFDVFVSACDNTKRRSPPSTCIQTKICASLCTVGPLEDIDPIQMLSYLILNRPRSPPLPTRKYVTVVPSNGNLGSIHTHDTYVEYIHVGTYVK